VTGVSSETSVLYDERLYVPLRWWVQATMFLATVWLAFVVALPLVVASLATALLAAGVVALFVGYGSARVRVERDVLHAGRASIPVSMLAGPVPLGPEATRHVAGRDADVRAYLLLRPYLKRSVRVEVTDPADPVPYWLVSTRRPDALADALAAAGAQ
jgi:hypothetical protein